MSTRMVGSYSTTDAGLALIHCYIPSMQWSVEYTDVFGAWWNRLTAEEQDVNAAVILLQRFGPALRFPYSSSIASSRHSHMRELRVQHAGWPSTPGARRSS